MSLADNKTVKHDFSISNTLEAGLVLSGPEVKAIKKGEVDLKGSYISLDNNGEAWLLNTYIAPYKPARREQSNYNPHQARKLLLTAKELRCLIGKSKEAGISILPLKIFFKNRLVKLEIGIGRGQKKYDKREIIKKRDFERRKRKLM